MEPIKCLNHGYVKYVAHLDVAHLGTDASIIDAARMSTNGGFVSWEPYEGHPKGDEGLLSYLYRNQHMTPFEMCELVVEVQAPIFVVREWHRHRTFSYNEASARYAVMPDLHYLPPMERMVKQDQKNKQAGAAELLNEEDARGAIRLMEEEQTYLYRDYSGMLDAGLAREVARINTPVSRYTRFRAKANLRNWLGFLHLRMAENAQQEIRVFANAVAEIVKLLWPRTWALFEEHTLYGMHLSRTEAEEYRRWKAEQLPAGWRWCQAERIKQPGGFLDRNRDGTWSAYPCADAPDAGILHNTLAEAIAFTEAKLAEEK